MSRIAVLRSILLFATIVSGSKAGLAAGESVNEIRTCKLDDHIKANY
jgi:hypothetical protein